MGRSGTELLKKKREGRRGGHALETVASWWIVRLTCQFKLLEDLFVGRVLFHPHLCLKMNLEETKGFNTPPRPSLYCQRGTKKACYLKSSTVKKNNNARASQSSQSHDCFAYTAGFLGVRWTQELLSDHRQICHSGRVFAPSVQQPLKRKKRISCTLKVRASRSHTLPSYLPTEQICFR